MRIAAIVFALTGLATVGNAMVFHPWSGAKAVVVVTSPGTGAPPGTLGGYSMVGFPSEGRSEFDMVTDVVAPSGFANLIFDQELELDFVGSGWDSWSHGYGGAVYQLFEEAVSGRTSLMITLPPGTLGFYTYIEPNQKGTYEFTVTSGSTTTTLGINGDGGARYVGFYTDDTLDPLFSVYVDQPDGLALGFAVGEFGIAQGQAVPDTGSCLGLMTAALGALGLFGRRSLRK